ncbi:SPRY domain-containing protein [Winogradskyella helgolandensis]|uniref:hypothetical protein n=1 Tax=Winogradskyella helgolandensis TaxID=2697010 RepID=UPI0015CC056A|nr:hypothetical protein [Winogradskyella helgolandensis]
MRTLKIVFFMTIVIIVMPCFSQNLDRMTISEKIIYETEHLRDTEAKLIASKEALLKVLMDSEEVNSGLIKNQREAIKALELKILMLKASLFELDEGVKNTKPEDLEFANNDILSHYSKNNKDGKSAYIQFKDIRNPIAFTKFIIRNPRFNGKNIITKHANASSTNFIKPGSIINILFDDSIYKKITKNKDVKLKVSAYLKRFDGTVVPITVSGFFEVEVKTDKEEFEQNLVSKGLNENPSLAYNYTITAISRGPIQAEVNTSMANPQPKDKLIITVTNESDGNVSLTTTFEYEDYGWESTASGGFAWVNGVNSGNSNFKPAGSSGMSFHYKLNSGARFWRNLFNPSFGPELLVLQDGNENTNVGLGLSVSTFLRSVKVGYGWYLVGESGRPYVSIGVNFVEGYKSISSILARSKD